MIPPVALQYQVLTGACGGDAPRAIGQKFEPDGGILRFQGNTFICRIPKGPAHTALIAAQTELGAVTTGFAWLPPSSFHMTVFEGVIDADRSADNWPQGMDQATPLAKVTDHFSMQSGGVICPRFAIRPLQIFGGYSVHVTGLTDEDTVAMQQARSMLQSATNLHRPSFAGYGFHITLGYPLRWLTNDEAHRMIKAAAGVFSKLAVAVNAIKLGPIEFCTFDDMHHFETCLLLG